MGERRALIVATSVYSDPTFTELRSPSGDAEALKDVLADTAIGQFSVTTELNVGKMQAEREIERLLEEAYPDDLVLLYITGHGVRHHSGKLYFIANDTEFNLLRSTAISASFVNDAMSASLCDRIIVMLDCCFSGAFAQGFATKGAQMQLHLTAEDEAAGLGGRGRVVISASNAMEYSYEGLDLLSEDVHRSVFTSAIVDGLRSGDADVDRDGRVSVDDLYSYVYEQVRARQSGQTPVKSTSGLEGTLFVARSPRWIAHDRPRWDPVSGRCENVGGAPVVDRQWQVSAPRDLDVGRSVPPGQVIELGLRNKFGAPTEAYDVSATVFAPDDTSTRSETLLHGDSWAYLHYPSDFPGAAMVYPPGVYTVLWEVSEGYLSCDGFVVAEQVTYGAEREHDFGLDDFEHAWRELWEAVERAQEDPEGSRATLESGINRMISARSTAREVLAAQHGGWVGDQILEAREVSVGASARKLDELTEQWDRIREGLSSGDMLRLVEGLRTEP